jgi:hypothetical protein
MKQRYKLLAIGMTSAFSIATGVQAQQDQPEPTPVVEIFPCTYRDNNDVDNLRTVGARFNTWADRNSMTNYTAFIATPYAYSAELEADVLWLGGWPNGTAMGVAETRWLAEGSEVAAAFDAVVECNSHSLYAEVVVNQPSGPPPENAGIAMFEDCTVREGRTADEALGAIEQWNDYTKSRGGDAFSAVLFPLAGLGNEADYTFKIVTGFNSMEAFGKGLDMYTGGGFMLAEQLFSRLLECNSPRVYTLERVRLAAEQPSG